MVLRFLPTNTINLQKYYKRMASKCDLDFYANRGDIYKSWGGLKSFVELVNKEMSADIGVFLVFSRYPLGIFNQNPRSPH